MWRRIILLLSLSSVYAINGKCRILAIGGGSERGAYEAGAIIGLINNLPAESVQWDVVTGVGVGALNALIVGSLPQGQEQNVTSKLNTFWSSFTYSAIYQDWIGGLITGLTLESGLYDSSPLKKTVTKLSPTKFQRWVGVGTTDLLTGSYVFFNSSGQTLANMQTGIYASASEPGILPIVKYSSGKYQLVSGSIKFSVDLLSGINACEQLGYSNANTIIHAVMGAGLKLKEVEAINYKTLQVTLRYLEIVAFDLFMQVLENAQHDFPDVNIEYTIYPSTHLNRTLVPYDFTPAELQQQLTLGQQDAQNAVKTNLASSR
jgi:predicted patatin/cPLA2 family phospholipase